MSTSRYQQAIDKVSKAGQQHVVQFWNELDAEQRNSLVSQIESINFEDLRQIYEQRVLGHGDKPFAGQLEPIDIISIPQTEEDFEKANSALQKGEELITAGKVAAVLVAGGQGTRLGFDGPKGMFPLTLIRKKTLFQMHAERIDALNRYYGTLIPWYIMTSNENDSETKEFFKNNDYFGLSKEDVFFFTQGMLPAIDEEGRLILDSKYHIFENPNGHGGIFSALRDSGALDDIKKRHIEELFYFQVDNVLIKICDPYFIGYHRLAHADMSAKVVSKRNPYEKVGIIGKLNGKPTVIEYSDLPESAMKAREKNGRLKYNAGSIAIHMINTRFVERITNRSTNLPLHVAHKKIEYIDSQGKRITPDEPNGYKLEMFIFDALPEADHVVVMEVDRAEEFSPIKNEKGDDSPETARRHLIDYYGRVLCDVGIDLKVNDGGQREQTIEISPKLILDKNQLQLKIDNIDTDRNQLLIE